MVMGDGKMASTVHYTKQDERSGRPHWHQYDGAYREQHNAIRRANNLVLDHGGYACVKDAAGKVIWGTDPADLDRAIAAGTNKHFRHVSEQAT